MKRIHCLKELIIKCEKNNAEKLLQEIRSGAINEPHADAFEKIILIETAKELNLSVAGFYCNTDELSKKLFSENPPHISAVLKILCDNIRTSSQENNKRAFLKARAYIEENLCDNQLCMENVAEYAGISQSLLVKLFKENEGLTPGEFLAKKRVERSLLVLEKDETVNGAAQYAGFSSDETYIRTFKKVMGVTPGEWKRNKLFL